MSGSTLKAKIFIAVLAAATAGSAGETSAQSLFGGTCRPAPVQRQKGKDIPPSNYGYGMRGAPDVRACGTRFYPWGPVQVFPLPSTLARPNRMLDDRIRNGISADDEHCLDRINRLDMRRRLACFAKVDAMLDAEEYQDRHDYLIWMLLGYLRDSENDLTKNRSDIVAVHDILKAKKIDAGQPAGPYGGGHGESRRKKIVKGKGYVEDPENVSEIDGAYDDGNSAGGARIDESGNQPDDPNGLLVGFKNQERDRNKSKLPPCALTENSDGGAEDKNCRRAKDEKGGRDGKDGKGRKDGKSVPAPKSDGYRPATISDLETTAKKPSQKPVTPTKTAKGYDDDSKTSAKKPSSAKDSTDKTEGGGSGKPVKRCSWAEKKKYGRCPDDADIAVFNEDDSGTLVPKATKSNGAGLTPIEDDNGTLVPKATKSKGAGLTPIEDDSEESADRARKIREEEDWLIDRDYVDAPSGRGTRAWNCSPDVCERHVRDDATAEFLDALESELHKTLDSRRSTLDQRLDALCKLKCVARADKDREEPLTHYAAEYVRRRVPWYIPGKDDGETPIRPVRPDVQAALVVIGAADRGTFEDEIDLRGSDLRGADMRYANLESVNLSGSNLSATDLGKASGLDDWWKIYLVTIDETSRIPNSISAGFIPTRDPYVPPPEPGSYRVTTEDWIWWNATPVSAKTSTAKPAAKAKTKAAKKTSPAKAKAVKPAPAKIESVPRAKPAPAPVVIEEKARASTTVTIEPEDEQPFGIKVERAVPDITDDDLK